MTENELKLIEYTYQQIYMHCQDSLYCPPAENQKSAQKIISAATTLLTDATSMFRGDTPCGPLTKLSCRELKKLMTNILNILTETTYITAKENKISKLLEKEKLAAETLLSQPDWRSGFLDRIQY